MPKDKLCFQVWKEEFLLAIAGAFYGVHTEASDENTLQLNVWISVGNLCHPFQSSGSIKEKGGREIQTADYCRTLSSGYVKAGCYMLELQQLYLSAQILSIL